MFIAFICGYFMGKHVLGLTETASLILSLIVGVGTIILETTLFIIKMERIEEMARKSEKSKLE